MNMIEKESLEQEAINEVMDWFDFDKVKKVMDALEWKWHSIDDVPSTPEIRQYARKLLKQCVNGGSERLECGGFVVTYSDSTLKLEFTVEDFEVEF